MDAPLTRRVLPLGLLCLGLVAGCVMPASLPAGRGSGEPAVPVPPGCPSTLRGQVLERVNVIRREHGLGPLRPELDLVEAAQGHTEDQAASPPEGIGHIGSDRSTPGERATRAGYRWRMVAENVAAGYATPGEVVAGWMDSPPHRATILAPDPDHGGVGHVYQSGGTLRHFWTLMVASPAGAGAPGGAHTPRGVDCHP